MMQRIPKKSWLLLLFIALVSIIALLIDVLKGDLASRFPALPLPIILLGLAALIVLDAVVAMLLEKQKAPPTMPQAEALSSENRQRMLNLVQEKWITGFLKVERYYDKDLLPLEFHRCVGDPFASMLENPLDSAVPLPPGTKITEVYDQARGELLILGEPGSGKSTLLLELTCDLLEQANNNKEAHIPVVLLLSSWAIKQSPNLEDWIADELYAKYHVPSEFGRAWAQTHQLLLLLDGLDEVTPELIPSCIDALNEYARKAEKALVVCCRTKEYLAQPARLCLHTAVSVQPLSPQHIDAYLSTQGVFVSGLKNALRQSPALMALASTPLFLKVLVWAYHGKSEKDVLLLTQAVPAEQPAQLWHNYVERVIVKEEKPPRATPQQTIHWLAWLAQQLTAHHQSEFYLEDLQPDWLPERQSRWYLLSRIALTGLIGGLIGGLLLGLYFGTSGLFSQMYSPPIGWSVRKLVGWLAWELYGGLSLGLLTGLVVGLIGWLIGALVGWAVGWLAFGLIGALVGWAVGWLAFGFGEQVSEHLHHSPNGSIKRSVKSGLVGGLLISLLLGLVFGLVGGLLLGLVGGLLLGLGFAAQHAILHLWLWQAGCTPAPWWYVTLLDDTVEQLILRRIGSGYIFRHPSLQDYFALLEPKKQLLQALLPPLPTPVSPLTVLEEHKQRAKSP